MDGSLVDELYKNASFYKIIFSHSVDYLIRNLLTLENISWNVNQPVYLRLIIVNEWFDFTYFFAKKMLRVNWQISSLYVKQTLKNVRFTKEDT